MPMTNNNERFSIAPQMGNIETSTFKRPFNIKLTCDAGKLIPFICDEMVPGDIFRFKDHMLIRGQTPKFPTMDNAYVDVFYFAVPWRLVWTGTAAFFKENESNTAGIINPANEKHIPQVTIPAGGIPAFSPADYMGLPVGRGAGVKVNALPFRAYRLIHRKFFRDQNVEVPVSLSTGDTETDTTIMTQLLDVNKLHDYFTSALPWPQKSADVLLPLGTTAPVIPRAGVVNTGDPLVFHLEDEAGGEHRGAVYAQTVTDSKAAQAFVDESSSGISAGTTINGSNLIADLSGSSVVPSISQVRTAFQLQRVYEKLARGGSRYNEFVRSFFHVNVPDARAQRPEMIGKYRINLNTREVIQTSDPSTPGTSTPTGSTGGYLRAYSERDAGVYAATEHCYVLGLFCIRTDMTYSQGIDRMWSRRDFTDVYLPALAHISETPIYNKELYVQGTNADNQVFGYQEAWAEYRHKVSKLAGAFGKPGTNMYDGFTYAHKEQSLPTLSSTFMKSTAGADVGKTLALQTVGTGEQFIFDIYVENTCTRPMPLYSVPGMVDHF